MRRINKGELLARADAVIQKGRDALASADVLKGPGLPRGYNPEYAWVKPAVAAAFRTAGLSLLSGLFGEGHHTYRDFDRGTKDTRTLESFRGPVAIIEGVREEIDRGWLDSTKALISADIFSNILEMAEYLLSEGYKDASAVLVGGALEGHLRTLATGRGVDTHAPDRSGVLRPRKAQSLNQELCQEGAYALGDQKQVTAWLNLRNDAAHGDHDKYTTDQVILMQQGVANFIVRVPE